MLNLQLATILIAFIVWGCSTATVRPENEDPIATFRPIKEDEILPPDRVVSAGMYGKCGDKAMFDSNGSIIRKISLFLDRRQFDDKFSYQIWIYCHSVFTRMFLILTKPELTCGIVFEAIHSIPVCRNLDSPGRVSDLADDMAKYFIIPTPNADNLLTLDTQKSFFLPLKPTSAYMLAVGPWNGEYYEFKFSEVMLIRIDIDGLIMIGRFYAVSNDEIKDARLTIPNGINRPEVDQLAGSLNMMRKHVEQKAEQLMVRK